VARTPEGTGGDAEAHAPIERRNAVVYDGAARPHIQSREGRDDAMSDTKTVSVGDPAPDFSLKTIGLKEIRLQNYRGKNVVLLFYPLDWTPG
jgi:hypothetical protein